PTTEQPKVTKFTQPEKLPDYLVKPNQTQISPKPVTQHIRIIVRHVHHHWVVILHEQESKTPQKQNKKHYLKQKKRMIHSKVKQPHHSKRNVAKKTSRQKESKAPS
uniref:hypothetical protein n=1 Tax=Secundilactobacillus odoratitofui TaxID=480930 RepID=UPI000AC3DD51